MEKVNSKAKGKRGELEASKLLRSQGHTQARRGQQFSGLHGDADVIGVKGVHIEVKRQEKTHDELWLKQAERDATKGEVPVVMYRRNHEKWKILIRQDIADYIWQQLTITQKNAIRDFVKFNHP